ncbi:putative ribonuclease H-like domain-containing protein [Tanacetum coccineum]
MEEPPTDLELKPLPDNLEYVFLEEPYFLPVIISSQLSKEKKNKLVSVLKKHKEAFAWKTTDIPSICPSICKHKIQLLDDKKPVVQKQRRLNPNMQEVVKKEIVKLLDTSTIYPIADSPWVSPIHCVPKKGGITVVTNENNELVPTRTITGWRVCIDYRKLNEATTKDHFHLPFMDQMLERLAGNKYFCFLDGFSGYFQIPIDPNDQEKTTFTCSFGTYAYRRMPFWSYVIAPCHNPKCMFGHSFNDMIEESVEVFMDDFFVFGNSFDTCLNNLDKMLQRCKEAHLVLNWEKCHFMVKEGIMLGHKVSSAGLEVDKAKIDFKGIKAYVLAREGCIRSSIKFRPLVRFTRRHPEVHSSNGFAGTKACDKMQVQLEKRQKPCPKITFCPTLWTAGSTIFIRIQRVLKDDDSKPSSDYERRLMKIQEKEIDEDGGVEADMNNLDTTIQVSPNLNYKIHKDHPLDQVIEDLQSATQTRKIVKEFLKEHGFAFLYGKIEEEVYVCQPPRFEDPYFPDRVYKVEKALYGLHQAPRAWYKGDILLMSSMGELTIFLGLQVKQKNDGIFISQDKYIVEILKKFRFTDVKTASTPMETQKPLLKDEDGEEVDVHMYRSMIGSLMYLTSSRPDIMFAVCACARYQVNPKVSHLHDVKRIFRYLKGQPKLGLWYLKDSPFDLVAYTDSDYAGSSLDRKSTTGGCQFLGCRLISWQYKKQKVVANSTIEAEYVAALSYYGQVLWTQNQLLNYGYNFMHTKIFIDNTRKAKKRVKLMMEKLFRMELELMLFWSTVNAKTINGEAQLHALVDGKKIIITESSIRRDLQLADEEGIDCLPNSTIFEQLALMGPKTTTWNEFSSTMASAIICLATNQKFNFLIFDSMIRNLDNVSGKFLMYPRFVQIFLDQQLEEISTYKRIYITPSHTKKIFGNMRRIGKDFSGRLTPLFPTMVVQNQSQMGEGSANPTDHHHTPTFIQPSPQPQKIQKTRKPKRNDTQVTQSSDPTESVVDEAVHKELGDNLVRVATTASSLEAEQDSGNINKTRSKATPNESSSQGTNSGGGSRCQETMGDNIAQTRFENVSKHSNDSLLARGNTLQSDEDRLKLDELMALCTTLQNRVLDLEKTKTTQHNEIASLKRRVKKLKKKNRIDAIDVDEEITLVSAASDKVSAASATTTTTATTVDDITLAQALEEMKSTKPKTKGVVIQELGESKTTKSSQLSSQQSQDKAEFDEEERLAREKAEKEQEANIVLIETWNDILAKIDVDHQLAERLQAQEQEELSIEEKATLFQQLLEKRRKHFAAKRAEEIRNKPPTKAQQRKIMSTYLKNMEGYKLKDLKSKGFDSIQEMFDRAFKRVNIFEDFIIELVEGKEKRAGAELVQESTKKQKVEDDKEIAELKQLMKIIPDEEEVAIDDIPLAVKSPSIVGWNIHKEGRKSYYQIMRADGKSQMYMIFSHMLKSFYREDLETLYKLVKAKYELTRPVEDLDLLLWG